MIDDYSPELYIMCGIPLSGKSTYCKKFPHCIIISRDDIRDEIMKEQGTSYKHTKENEKEVTKRFDHKYKHNTFFQNDIILDNTHCKTAYLEAEIKRAPVEYNVKIIFLECPLWKAYIRNVLRYLWCGKWIPFKVINDMKRNFDKIDKKKYEHLVYE